MALMRVRLELARSQDFPEGSSSHGYEFVAPLNKDGHIDASAWQKVKDKCSVVRFWGEAPEEEGMLRHVGHGWRFDYDKNDDDDDEPFFKLDKHALEQSPSTTACSVISGSYGDRRLERVASKAEARARADETECRQG